MSLLKVPNSSNLRIGVAIILPSQQVVEARKEYFMDFRRCGIYGDVHRSERREFARSERRLFIRSDRRHVKDFVKRVGVHAKTQEACRII